MKSPPPLSGTRLVSSLGAGRELVAVRCARIKVSRGPDKGREILLGERRSAVIGTSPDADLPLRDDSVSRRHAEVCAEESGYRVRDLGSTNGVRVDGVLVREAILDRKSALVSLGETDLQFSFLDQEVQVERSGHQRFGLVVGAAPVMREMFALLERAAESSSTVLLEGESGTGKERIAQSLHRLSPRASSPFVIVDCATIPPNLMESELFGHERGAFTSADSVRVGALEEASGGSVFFDEIGEMPLELQPKLLRVLESRQIKRVGSSKYQDVDLRVIAATNRDLASQVTANKFRADLYYRLAVVRVSVPPLRHHLEDLPLLARECARQIRPDADPSSMLSDGVMAALASYGWPGNVRELRNAIERLLAIGNLDGAFTTPTQPPTYHDARQQAIDGFERAYCVSILQRAKGVVADAAELAGLSRQMMYRLLAKHDLRGS